MVELNYEQMKNITEINKRNRKNARDNIDGLLYCPEKKEFVCTDAKIMLIINGEFEGIDKNVLIKGLQPLKKKETCTIELIDDEFYQFIKTKRGVNQIKLFRDNKPNYPDHTRVTKYIDTKKERKEITINLTNFVLAYELVKIEFFEELGKITNNIDDSYFLIMIDLDLND